MTRLDIEDVPVNIRYVGNVNVRYVGGVCVGGQGAGRLTFV